MDGLVGGWADGWVAGLVGGSTLTHFKTFLTLLSFAFSVKVVCCLSTFWNYIIIENLHFPLDAI